MGDSNDFESEDERDSRRQRYLGKRRAREIEDDSEEDQVDDFDIHEMDDDEELETRTRAVGSSSRRANDPIDDDHHDEEDRPTFRPACLCEWGKTIVQKEALQLSAEYLRLFTIEALHRTAAYQREQEDEELRNEESLIELDSLEAITPQLVLDF
ncbi:hypothetical protein BGX31_001336 [Mortierella sp. GBA43]|nr:hypothetical protein BGX31_001336 [Mortierella sp. GBA43]